MGLLAKSTLCLPSVLLLASCSSQPATTPSQASARDSAGVAIVISAHDLGETGWSISTEPILEVTTSDDDPDMVLHWIRGAVRLSTGRIVLLSESAGQLLFLEPAGDLAFTVGREGDGPGELRRAFQLSRVPGDTLIVTDRGAGHQSWFSPEGKFLRRSTPDRSLIQTVIPETNIVSFARFVAPGYTLAEANPRGLRPNGVRIRRPRFYALLGPDQKPKSLGSFPGWEGFSVSAQNGRWAFFADNTVVAVGGEPTLIYVGDSGVPEIRAFDLRGQLVSIIRDLVPPSPITEQDIQWERWELLDWGEQSGQYEQFIRLADAMPLPDTKPAFEDLVVDRSGLVWAKEYSSYKPTPILYRIYDQTGARVGHAALPGRLKVFDIGEDYVLGVHSDLDYVETLQMYELRRPEP